MLLPALGSARESANRVVCRSNIRQIGLGVLMYTDANQDFLPPSVYSHPWGTRTQPAPQEMMHLRLPPGEAVGTATPWDGLGLLYQQEYLPAPKIFYCPSYHGMHSFRDTAGAWLDEAEPIVGNFHYREFGVKPKRITLIPSGSAIVTDGLRTLDDYSHENGANVFRSDLSVEWFADSSGAFADALASTEGAVDPSKVKAAWKKLDPDGTK